MKNITFLLAFLLAAACAPQPENTVLVGGDRDAHSCIGSAGYTWSDVRQGCIRLWEEGTALMPVTEIENPVLVGYVVRSANWKEAEIFLPDMQGSVVLTLQVNPNQTQWSSADGQWQLFYNKEQGWMLTQNGVAVYQAPAQADN
jgi:hypothetical protein